MSTLWILTVALYFGPQSVISTELARCPTEQACIDKGRLWARHAAVWKAREQKLGLFPVNYVWSVRQSTGESQ